MSHSTVLVVISDASNVHEAEAQLDELLAPFDENTDVDPYVEWVDGPNRAVAFYREHPEHCPGEDGYGPEKPFDEFVTEGNLEAWREWMRQAVGAYHRSDRSKGVYDEGTDRYGAMSTYNPRSRWDWWALGGRWGGTFLLKQGVAAGARQRTLATLGEGTDNRKGLPPVTTTSEAILNEGHWGGDGDEVFDAKADLARKGDIDFEQMRTMAVLQAEVTYDKFEKATAGLEVAPTFQELARLAFVEAGVDPELEFRDFMPEEEDHDKRRAAWQAILDVARTQYREHPWMKVLADARLLDFFGSPHDTFCVNAGGRDKYIERARKDAGRTFALLVDGEWYEEGRMGWWGVVADEKDPDLWAREYWRKVDSLPDDVYLAVVDVHI